MINRDTTRSHFGQHGFSLIETLVVISISTLVFLAIMTSIRFFYRTNEYSVEQAAAISSSRNGIEEMVQDIREASYSNTGAYPVAEMSTSSFTFFADIDRDQTVERVRYFLDGSDFKQATTKPSGSPVSYTDGVTEVRVISDNVRNSAQDKPVFTYFDASGTAMGDFSARKDLTFVSVELIVNVDPNRQPDNITLYSGATLRNVNKPS